MQKTDIERCTIFSTITGSTAYGTNTPTSDIDIRGIAIPDDVGYYTGFLKHFEQYEDPTKDTVIYDIRKAFKLISDCNPNMLDLLFTDSKFYQKITPYWERVLDKRDAFLSKKARYTYTGYAFAQLKRIKNHRGYLLNPPKGKPERSDFGLPDRKILSKDGMGGIDWLIAKMLEDSVQYTLLTDAAKEELSKLNYIGLVQSHSFTPEQMELLKTTMNFSDGLMQAVFKEKEYENALTKWNSYQSWKNTRNAARSALEEKHGYDTKHAAHLVRLMRMGKEILETGKVQVYRPDREELLAIRNGAWKYEQIEEYAEKMETEIVTAYETSKLPREPDRPALDELCSDIIYDYALS